MPEWIEWLARIIMGAGWLLAFIGVAYILVELTKGNDE